MSVVVNQISSPTITAWKITTETAGDVQIALATVAMLGWKGRVESFIQPNSSTLVWTVTLLRNGFANLVGSENDWIVSDGTNVNVLGNDAMQSCYTANIPVVWDATTTAPSAASPGGLNATITCPCPTSINGPFTWTVEANNTSTSTTSQLDLQPAVSNGVLTFTYPDLEGGNDYVFEVTCNTQYEGVSASSLPTASVTVMA